MYYYLAHVYNAEQNIEGKVSELLRAHENSETYPKLQEYLDDSVRKLKAIIGENFDTQGFLDERNLLYKNIYASRAFVLAGSAGSGKSYEILNIIKQFEEQGQTYLLLAPTGKAALRLKSDPDFQGIASSTIDKFIFNNA